MTPLEPVTLAGRFVRLEPLARDHHEPLCAVGLEPDLWRWTWDAVRTAADLSRYIDTALGEQAAGRSLPFAIVERSSGRAIGSTRYGNIEPAHRRLEIGWTWLGTDGRVRDTAYFSITDDEWPRVKARLVERLARGALDSSP